MENTATKFVGGNKRNANSNANRTSVNSHTVCVCACVLLCVAYVCSVGDVAYLPGIGNGKAG